MNLDDRLRAAGSALREGSVTQVDAATGLRAIILCADPDAGDQAGPLDEPAGDPARSLPPPAPPPLRRPQRLALAVNLLLVVALGAVLVVAVQRDQDTGPVTTVPTASAAPATVPPSTAPSDRHLGPGAVPRDGRAGRPGDLAPEPEHPRRAALPGPAGLHHRQPGVPEAGVALAVTCP